MVEGFVCEVYGKYARPVKRPIAANVRTPEFNFEVGADVTSWRP